MGTINKVFKLNSTKKNQGSHAYPFIKGPRVKVFTTQ